MSLIMKATVRSASTYEPLIFSLGQRLNTGEMTIEAIGDYLPGCIMVQNITRLTNTYMNKAGCKILRHTAEELTALGPAYFDLFFPREEIAAIKPRLFQFVKQNDVTGVYSFFQRVRPDQKSDYKWYLSSTKLHLEPGNTDIKIVNIAVEVSQLHTITNTLHGLYEQQALVQKNYRKYQLLTLREKEIIKLIVAGQTSYAIAEQLFISVHTVNNHRKNILKKLDINNLSELIKLAMAFQLC